MYQKNKQYFINFNISLSNIISSNLQFYWDNMIDINIFIYTEDTHKYLIHSKNKNYKHKFNNNKNDNWFTNQFQFLVRHPTIYLASFSFFFVPIFYSNNLLFHYRTWSSYNCNTFYTNDKIKSNFNFKSKYNGCKKIFFDDF